MRAKLASQSSRNGAVDRTLHCVRERHRSPGRGVWASWKRRPAREANLRRLITAPALVLATFVFASSAQAQVEQRGVEQSRASVEDYWTSDRMQAATPAEKVLGGDGVQAKAAPLPWSSQEVTTPYTQAPTSTHGKVFFTLGGVDYVCSGTALLSANKSVVWTAGHCVIDPAHPGDFATNWQFVPAYKDGSAALGVYVA